MSGRNEPVIPITSSSRTSAILDRKLRTTKCKVPVMERRTSRPKETQTILLGIRTKETLNIPTAKTPDIPSRPEPIPPATRREVGSNKV